jgi:hypothetical protein
MQSSSETEKVLRLCWCAPRMLSRFYLRERQGSNRRGSCSAISAICAFPACGVGKTSEAFSLYTTPHVSSIQVIELQLNERTSDSSTMAHLTRRLFCTTNSKGASAAEACSEIYSRFGEGSKPISVRKQILDANQLQLLSTTLDRSPTSIEPPKEGTPIPPGHHLVYFTPSIAEQELGRDGTDRTVNPLSPFTRRMWAGGHLEWNQDPSSRLKVGQNVIETTKILSAEPRKLKSGGEMIVVGVEKTFENDKGVALTDRRNWVFQKEIGPKNSIKVPLKPETKALPKGTCFSRVAQHMHSD